MKTFASKSKKTTETKKSNPFLEMILEGIEKLEQKNWQHYLKSTFDFNPKNAFTKLNYRRFNRFALLLDIIANNFQTSSYATFNQISKAGGKIKKGAKGVVIQYFNYDVKHLETNKRITLQEYMNLSEKEKENYKVNSFAKYFRVFNIAWIENIDEMNFETEILDETLELEDIDLNDDAEKFIQRLINDKGLKLDHKACNTAYYAPFTDSITMPKTEQFKNESKYYTTLFHEILHWTGHPNRLNRFKIGKETEEKYAFEELVAEMGSMLLSFDFNYKEEFINSLVYLKGWAKSTSKDLNRIETLANAFKLSNQAVNYIYK